MQKKLFSLDEVNKMLPMVKENFNKILQMHAQVKAICTRLDEAGFLPDANYLDLNPPGATEKVLDDLSSLKMLVETVNERLRAVQKTGAIIRDVETGLVDWPAKQNGEPIYYCWKLGESEVKRWHDGDYANREVIEEEIVA